MNEIIISQIRQRLEILYQMVDELERSGGGGEPGTTNYNDLSNKPSVNGHTLIGAKTSSDLDLQPVISDLSTIRSGAALGATAVQPAIMNEALADKQDTLTFDTTPTNGSSNPVKSSGVYTALDNKVDKVNGKDLSTNDFTNADKAQITTNKNNITQLTERVLNKQDVLLYTNRANTNTFNFNGLSNIPDSTHFKYGILIGGGAASNPGKVMIWHVFINTSETVFFTKIIGDDTMTLTGSISDGVLTITSSATIYGGLRLIWLG